MAIADSSQRTEYLLIELAGLKQQKLLVLIEFWDDISQMLDQIVKIFQSSPPAHTLINYCSNK
jgi:hypothetical protein